MEPQISINDELIVIGAGPAGLMAALTAVRAGHRVTVLEASPAVGGMAGSFEVAGQRVDHGSHRLHPATDPDLLAVIRAMLGDDLQLRARNGRIRLGGRWIGFPLRAPDMARQLPIGLTGRIALDTLTRPLRRAAPDASFQSEMKRRLGPTVTARFYGPYARKLYGLDPTLLGVELADRRVSVRSPAAVVARALRPAGSHSRTFYYPRRGFGQIAEALAEAVMAAGAEIHLNTPATRIGQGERLSVEAGNRSFGADMVLTTMPLPHLAVALRPPPADEVTVALGRLRNRAMVLVYLVLDQDRYTPFDAHYLPGTELAVSRLSEPKNYRSGDDPAGTTVLCAEVPCWPDDELWRSTDDDLAALVADDLTRAGLPTPHPVGVEVRRLRSVYPVYETATTGDRLVVDRFTRDVDRVVTLGRQGLGVPDNLHHVLAMGEAAGLIAGGSPSARSDRWGRHLDAFARHVVQD